MGIDRRSWETKQTSLIKRSSKSTYSPDGCPYDLAVLTRRVEALNAVTSVTGTAVRKHVNNTYINGRC